jgi:hypothetical protein
MLRVAAATILCLSRTSLPVKEGRKDSGRDVEVEASDERVQAHGDGLAGRSCSPGRAILSLRDRERARTQIVRVGRAAVWMLDADADARAGVEGSEVDAGESA